MPDFPADWPRYNCPCRDRRDPLTGQLIGITEIPDGIAVARAAEAGHAVWLTFTDGRQHVPAKRYLCAVEPAYFALLSPASVYTLSVQGGPMTAAEAARFEAEPFAADAVAVRRWDDAAKDPAAAPPGFAHFRPLLESLS